MREVPAEIDPALRVTNDKSPEMVTSLFPRANVTAPLVVSFGVLMAFDPVSKVLFNADELLMDSPLVPSVREPRSVVLQFVTVREPSWALPIDMVLVGGLEDEPSMVMASDVVLRKKEVATLPENTVRPPLKEYPGKLGRLTLATLAPIDIKLPPSVPRLIPEVPDWTRSGWLTPAPSVGLYENVRFEEPPGVSVMYVASFTVVCAWTSQMVVELPVRSMRPPPYVI
jgi:hypothetical protein